MPTKQEQINKAEKDLKETRANYCHPIGCDACPLNTQNGEKCKAQQHETVIHNLEQQIKGAQRKPYKNKRRIFKAQKKQ